MDVITAIDVQRFVPPYLLSDARERQIELRISQIVDREKLVTNNMELVPAIGLENWLQYISKLVANPEFGMKEFTKCEHTARIRAGAITHIGCELMYTWPLIKTLFLSIGNHTKEEINQFNQAKFWEENVINALAIRNRLRIVKTLLQKAIKEAGRGVIRILSIASGSARAVIEVMTKFSSSYNVSAYFLDISQAAIEYSQELARQYGVYNRCEWVQNSFKSFPKVFAGLKPHIVEMVGLKDYLGDKTAINLDAMIYNFMPEHSVYITANVRPNVERDFIEQIVNWVNMKFRSPEQLAEILVRAGFGDRPEGERDIEFYREPLVHEIAFCHK